MNRVRRLQAAGGLAAMALLLVLSARGTRADGLPDGFTSLDLSYQDGNGPGTATITDQGADAATGGSAIAATITQNGVTFQGQGFALLTAPNRYVLAFYVTGPVGDVYFMEGTLTQGVDGWSGQGRYQGIQDPSRTDQWTMLARTPQRRPPIPNVPTAPEGDG